MSETVLLWLIVLTNAVIVTAALSFYGIRRFIMGALQDTVDALVTQLTKVQAEIQSKIADLEIQIGLGEELDLSALKAAAQSLDDIVPDVVPVEPDEPVEPEPVDPQPEVEPETPVEPEPESPVDPEAPVDPDATA